MRNILTILLVFMVSGVFGQHHMMYGLAESSGGGTTLKTNLISCWEMQETSGTTAYDSDSSNDGTYNNGVSLSENGITNIPKAISTDGVDDYISTGTSLITGYPFSISFWVKVPDVTIATFVFNTNMLSTSYNGATVFIRDAASGGSGVAFGNGIDIGINYRKSHYYSTNLSNDTWYHVVFTSTGFDYSNCKMYVNASEQTYSSSSGYSSSVSWSAGETTFCGTDWVTITYYSGYYTQVAIWNKELTSTEVSTLYNSGNGLAYSNW